MTPVKKHTWRMAIFAALLEIRSLSWKAQSIAAAGHSPDPEITKAMGDIADWCHNVAFFSSIDFEGFNETQPLSEAKTLLSKHWEKMHGSLRKELHKITSD